MGRDPALFRKVNRTVVGRFINDTVRPQVLAKKRLRMVRTVWTVSHILVKVEKTGECSEEREE